MTAITVVLDDRLAENLKQESDFEKVEEIDIARKAIDMYLRQKRMERIRNEMRPYAEAAGFLAEEDIFREIS